MKRVVFLALALAALTGCVELVRLARCSATCAFPDVPDAGTPSPTSGPPRFGAGT